MLRTEHENIIIIKYSIRAFKNFPGAKARRKFFV